MKIEDLKRLQKLQLDYIEYLDIQIETHNDQQQTMFSMTDFPQSKKFYVHKLSWLDDNTKEFEKIEEEIENIFKITTIPSSRHFINKLSIIK